MHNSNNQELIDESDNLYWFYQGYDVIVEQPVKYDIFNDDNLYIYILFEKYSFYLR